MHTVSHNYEPMIIHHSFYEKHVYVNLSISKTRISAVSYLLNHHQSKVSQCFYKFAKQ